MGQSGFPADVESFITRHIDSVDQLEILLLLHRDSSVAWSAADVARELRINEGPAAARLASFAEQGLLVTEGTGSGQSFRYRPARATDHAAVSGLAQAYRERRVAIITAIFSKPNRDILTFADAFRLRKDK